MSLLSPSPSLSSSSEVFPLYPHTQPVHYPVALPLGTYFPCLLSFSRFFFPPWYSTLPLIYVPSLHSPFHNPTPPHPTHPSSSLFLSLSLHSSFSGNRHLQSFKYGLFSVKLLNVSQLRAINRGCEYHVQLFCDG